MQCRGGKFTFTTKWTVLLLVFRAGVGSYDHGRGLEFMQVLIKRPVHTHSLGLYCNKAYDMSCKLLPVTTLRSGFSTAN